TSRMTGSHLYADWHGFLAVSKRWLELSNHSSSHLFETASRRPGRATGEITGQACHLFSCSLPAFYCQYRRAARPDLGKSAPGPNPARSAGAARVLSLGFPPIQEPGREGRGGSIPKGGARRPSG